MTNSPDRSSADIVDALAKTIWLAGFERAFSRTPTDPWENQAESAKAPHINTARKIIEAGFVTPAQPTLEEAVAAERERCAMICDGWIGVYGKGNIQYTSATEYATDAVQDIADAIRDGAKPPAVSSDGEPSNGKQPLMASRPAPPVPSDPRSSAETGEAK